MNFFKDGLSINETKVSLMMISFVVTLGFALWQFYTIGYIDGSALTLIAYQIGAITGINIADKFKRTDQINPNEIGD